jgi:DNA-binding GntR family transcriptional regulator
MATMKYIPLANSLRKEVLSGIYGTEGGLPATSELAKRHSSAVNTVKMALSKLEGEGIIVKRGLNYYVNTIHTTMTRHVPLPHARLHNRRGYVRTLHITSGLIPGHVASKLHLPDRDILIRSQVSGEVNGRELPLQLTTRYYFLSLSDAQVKRLEEDAGWDPMWELTGTLQSRDEVSARPATTQEAEQLKVPDGTTVITVFEVIRDPSGVLLMAQELTLSPRDTLIFEFEFENH